MDLLAETARSAWGTAAFAFAVTAVVAQVLLRSRLRTRLAAASLGLAILFLAAGVWAASPKVESAKIGRAAEIALVAAQAEIAAGRNIDAAVSLDTADGLFRQARAIDGVARVEIARGDLERLQGRLGEARARYMAAAVRLNAIAHRDIALALLRLGQVEVSLENREAAHKAFGQALPLFRRFGVPKGEAETALAEGTLARQSGEFGAATELLKTAAQRFVQLGDPLGQGRAILELARVSHVLLRPEVAIEAANTAGALFLEAGAPFGLVLMHLVLGEVLIDEEEGEYAHAEYVRAAALLAGIVRPAAAAGQFLRLSATDALQARGDAAVAANHAAYPDHHVEARTLLRATEASVRFGLSYALRAQ